MRIAYFDIFAGISGDMTIGAFLNAGLPLDTLESELAKLPLTGYSISEHRIFRSMISATKFDVAMAPEASSIDGSGATAEQTSGSPHVPEGEPDSLRRHEHPHEHSHEQAHSHEHSHERAEEHAHDHAHGPAHDGAHGTTHAHPRPSEQPHDHGHTHERSYVDIVRLIDASGLTDSVKTKAKAIFLAIGKAEAKIHGTTIDRVHFHEVGAVDSIVDIVGIAICMDAMRIERVYSSAVRTGSGGFIDTRHGRMPIPTPATLEILQGYPLELTKVPYELTTPTGAAVIAALSSGVLQGTQHMRVEAVGYGAGGREIPGMPNLLRLMIGTLPDEYIEEKLLVVETNIDDMNPEIYPYLLERLIESGAHDAYVTPVLMKKGRPGHLVSVTCPASHLEAAVRVIYSETTTSGVRVREVLRMKLPRDVRIVQTRYGSVTAKLIQRGEHPALVPEFEECRRIAREFSIPLLDVYKQMELDFAALS